MYVGIFVNKISFFNEFNKVIFHIFVSRNEKQIKIKNKTQWKTRQEK